MTTAVLDRIKADSRQIDKLRRELDKLQDRNDKNVVKARRSGVKFVEIAEASGRSVSWVQAAVRRADPSIITVRGPRSANGKTKTKTADVPVEGLTDELQKRRRRKSSVPEG